MMNNCIIEMFPALCGDCFLVKCCNKSKTNILIDTGFPDTYNKFLKNHLINLSESSEKLSLMVITHIDADHLMGGLKLLEDNGAAENPNIIKIEEIWHNSYRHLQFKKLSNKKLDYIQKELLNSIIVRGFPKEELLIKDKEEPIGAKQGSTLASLILKGRYSWNSHFQGRAVCSDDPEKIIINDDVNIVLLSPNKDKLFKLNSYWGKTLNRMGYKDEITEDKIFDDAFEFLLSHEKPSKEYDIEKKISFSRDLQKLAEAEFLENTSPTNGSSISFILEFGDKKILFLGDSHPSLIENNLKKIYQNQIPVYFDAIKISHHGSSGNTSPNLLALIDSENYLISTNGMKHNHPDLITLARIVTRKFEKKRKLIFNYSTESSDFMNNSDLMELYNYSIEISNENEIKRINL